jgi:acetyl esterase
MPLDPDAAQILTMMKQMGAPMAGPGTDAAAFRATVKAGNAMPREILPLKRVENFTIPGKGGSIPVRFYADSDAKDLPILVFMHGGGWVICDLDSHDALCRRIVKDSGWALLSVDYRLAPEHRFPAAIDDSWSALTWVAGEGAGKLGLDANRLAVCGDSAGGNLAAALALRARDAGGPKIVHQFLIYPAIEPGFDTPSYAENGKDYFLTLESMQWFWDQYFGPNGDRKDPLAAPGRAASLKGLPAATVLTAGFDPLRDEGKVYAEKLQAAGVPVVYKNYEGAFHGFISMDMLVSAKDAMKLLTDRIKSA